MRSIGMLLAAPALALAVVACGSGTAQLAKQTAVVSSTPASTAAPTPTASTVSLPSDPCQWLLETDAQLLLGTVINTRMDGINTQITGALECSYTPGTLEETASPVPGGGDLGVSVDILDSGSFANGQNPSQPDGVTYSTVAAAPSSIIPGASASDETFFAIGNGSSAHPAWTYLYVHVGGGVYFRVGMLDPSISAAQRQAKDQAAALDVLRNLSIH